MVSIESHSGNRPSATKTRLAKNDENEELHVGRRTSTEKEMEEGQERPIDRSGSRRRVPVEVEWSGVGGDRRFSDR